MRKILKSALSYNLVKSSKLSLEDFIKEYSKGKKDELEEFFNSLLVLVADESIDTSHTSNILKDKIQEFNLDPTPKNLEALYISFSTAALKKINKGLVFSFDDVDDVAVKSMRKGFYWMGKEYNDGLQNRLKDIMESSFKGEIPTVDLARTLKEEFGYVINADERYFKGVANHISLQAQNVATVTQGAKYDVKHYKVLALMDGRTTDICRSMHGRIIKASHLEEQCDEILNAENLAQKKAAASWRTKPILEKDLPKDFGLPPYHFQCRTEVVPVWIDEEVIDGKITHNTQPKKDDEIFRHIDKMGYERYAKAGLYTHSDSPKPPLKDIIASMNNIEKLDKHKDHPSRTVALSGKRVIIYQGDELWTIISKDSTKAAKEFYRKNTENELWKRGSYLSWLMKGVGILLPIKKQQEERMMN